MANELKLNVSINFSKGNAKVARQESVQVTITGDAFTHSVQSIGTSEEEITQGADPGTPGYMFIKNCDSTNYVEVGSTTGVYDIKLKAREIALYRHNSATVYAKANTAACLVEYCLVED